MRRISLDRPGGIVVEVERENVLVLLRRVLRVGDAAVNAGGEPLGVAFDPRVVRGGLQGKVQGHFQPQFPGPRHEGVEVLEGAQVRVDGVVAALLGPDGPGRAGIVRPGEQGVVRALAVLDADRVDRRHVDDVEAHGRDGVEALGGGAEGAGGPLAGVVVADGAFGPGEELVPGAPAGELALHQQRVLLGDGDQFADRLAVDDGGDLGAESGGEAFLGGLGGVVEPDDGHPQRPPVGGRAGGVLGGFGEQRGALGQHQLDVDAGFHLDLGVVVPGAVAVMPGLDHEGPVAGGGRGQEAFPAVGALAARAAGRGEADALAFLPAGVEQDGADAELVVALAEGGGAHHQGFARRRPWRGISRLRPRAARR